MNLKRTRTSNAFLPHIEAGNSRLFRPALLDKASENGPDAGSTAPTESDDSDNPADAFFKRFENALEDGLKRSREETEDRVKKVEDKLDEAIKNGTKNGKDVFTGGRAPAQRQGESVLNESQRGYSYSRIVAYTRTRNSDNCKLELEIHNKLMDYYDGLGVEGVLVPLATEHMNFVDNDLRNEIAQTVRQGVSTVDLDEMRWMKQNLDSRVNFDLSVWDETAGGSFLGAVQNGELIDLLRAKEILSRLGVREFTFPPNGRIVWPRVTGDTTGYWVGESDDITESQISTGSMAMTVKKLAAMSDFPRDLLKFNSISSEQVTRQSIVEQFARTLDTAALYGPGSEVKPRGLLDYTGVNTYVASSPDTDGDKLEPQDIHKMVATVAEQNVDVENFAFLMRPLLWADVQTRRADAVSAGDGAGPFVFKTQAERGQRISGTIGGYDVIDSTTIRNDRAKGASTDLTESIGGNWSEMLLGRLGAVEFDMDPYSGSNGTNFKKDIVSLRAIQYVDVKPRRPEAFIHVDDLESA